MKQHSNQTNLLKFSFNALLIEEMSLRPHRESVTTGHLSISDLFDTLAMVVQELDEPSMDTIVHLGRLVLNIMDVVKTQRILDSNILLGIYLTDVDGELGKWMAMIMKACHDHASTMVNTANLMIHAAHDLYDEPHDQPIFGDVEETMEYYHRQRL